MELFNDFILFELVENYLIIEYEDILPELILDIWEAYGFGSFMQGYFKIVNPNDFIDLIDDTCELLGTPILVSCMGEVFVYCDNECMHKLDYNRATISEVSETFNDFCESLKDDQFKNDYLDYNNYIEKSDNKIVDFDECYAYEPLLFEDGSELTSHLQSMKIKDHIYNVMSKVGRLHIV